MMPNLSTIDPRAVAAIAIGLTAVVCDLRTRRIPNVLTLGGAALALVAGLTAGGASGLAQAVGGWLLGAILFFPFFALGGMGAGDVKLIAALGAWLGPVERRVARDFFVDGRWRHRPSRGALRGVPAAGCDNIWLMLLHWRTSGLSPVPGSRSGDDRSAPRVCAPIMIGVVLTYGEPNPRRRDSESGQSIIELALTLPLLLVIVLGVFDFGFLFQRYEVVTNAAREGSRVGVLPGLLRWATRRSAPRPI